MEERSINRSWIENKSSREERAQGGKLTVRKTCSECPHAMLIVKLFISPLVIFAFTTGEVIEDKVFRRPFFDWNATTMHETFRKPSASTRYIAYVIYVSFECCVPLFRGTKRQFSENICPQDDLRSRIFGTFVVKFLACQPLPGFSSKWYNCTF